MDAQSNVCSHRPGVAGIEPATLSPPVYFFKHGYRRSRRTIEPGNVLRV